MMLSFMVVVNISVKQITVTVENVNHWNDLSLLGRMPFLRIEPTSYSYMLNKGL